MPEIQTQEETWDHGHHDVLYIYPAYTELRSRPNDEKNMNTANPDFKGFKTFNEKTRKEIYKRDKLRIAVRSKEQEYRAYIHPPKGKKDARSKRGSITEMSQKSSVRCRKTLCRIDDLSLWMDFTFADDIFLELDHQGIKEKSNEILKKYQKYLKGRGLKLFWKREWQPRKSGKLKGIRIPHFHTFIIGLTEEQKIRPDELTTSLFIKWVEITETTQKGDALAVCFGRKKDGSPASYRFIKSLKIAIKYVSKYFSKPFQSPGQDPVSIGRTWGYSKDLELAGSIMVTLDSPETSQIRRRIRKALKIRKSKSFQKSGLPYLGIFEQLCHQHSTFVFIPENLVMRLINRFVEDPFKVFYSDQIPF